MKLVDMELSAPGVQWPAIRDSCGGSGGIVVISQVWLSPGEGPRAGRPMYCICVTLSGGQIGVPCTPNSLFLLLSSEHPSSDSLRHRGPSHRIPLPSQRPNSLTVL